MTNAPAVLPVSEQMPSTTVRIRTRGFSDASWTGVGTGFVWTDDLVNDQGVVFLITNRHVLAGVTAVELTLQGTSEDGSRSEGPGRAVIVQLGELHITMHPDPEVDLALLALGPIVNRLRNSGFKPHFSAVGRSIVPSAEQIRELSAAHPVFVVGYPNGVYDQANNLPVIRRGTTAVAPWIDYQGNRDFLLDVAVFGGSSGSPVFVLDEGVVMGRQGLSLGGRRLFFLGVLKAGHYRTELGSIVQVPAPVVTSQVAQIHQMINLAVCVKAVSVLELVDAALAQYRLTLASPSPTAV